MKSSVLLAAVAALLVDAAPQIDLGALLGGGSSNPLSYTAGQAFDSANYNPLVLFDEVPPLPANFGGAAQPRGPAPKGCYPYEIIAARGTSEPGDFGVIVGDPVIARVQQDLGKDKVRGYAVQYDATMVSFVTPDGSNDIVNRIKNKATECPNQKFAVVGYSQGGSLVAGALGNVPANVQKNVLAVVLYAPFGGASAPAWAQKITLQNCADGDPVCLKGIDMSKHTSYNSKGTKWHEASRKFITAAFKGQPLQSNPGSSWSAAWLRAL